MRKSHKIQGGWGREPPQQDTNNKTKSNDKVPAKIKQADHYHTDFNTAPIMHSTRTLMNYQTQLYDYYLNKIFK